MSAAPPTFERAAVASLSAPEAETLAAILSALREKTGTDFSEYRHPTVVRRVRNRMMSVGATTFAEYLERVRTSSAEADALLDRITIKVSRFYRNAAVFDRIRSEVLPARSVAAGMRPLRIWSAGCGRGEEAYTLAMLLEHGSIPGSVVASDIDRKALEAAETGIYPSESTRELPADLARQYLEPIGEGARRLRVTPGIRKRVSLRVDDLAASTPAAQARFDLVCCRNVLIYLSPPAQRRVLDRIAGTLAPGGYLVLGEAEWPSPDALAGLGVVCPRLRIFVSRPGKAVET
jgi:chemotaxis protein methyltransferase CheR/two-component system CheB/CheR fusion protein